MERRPGIAYRRPEGDPSQFVIEADGRSQLDVPERPDGGWLGCVVDEDRGRVRGELRSDPVDVVYRVASGETPRWVHERGRTTEDGDVVGYLFLADERVRRRRRLERQRERLDEFASVVSHDLRNPLSVAVGNVELADRLDGEASAERLDRALDALDRMDDLIGDLLTLAREGETVDDTDPSDLRPVAERAWETVGGPTDAALVVEGPLGAVSCDADRLRQALENLFRNALEHGAPNVEPPGDGPTEAGSSPDDRVAPGTFSSRGGAGTDGATAPEDAPVRVRIGRTDDGFYVSDDGPGIEPDQRDAVFEPSHTTAPDGTGFGLAIVERIAEAHGWTVSVTESRDGGARFEFDCDAPVEARDRPETASGEASPRVSGVAGDGER